MLSMELSNLAGKVDEFLQAFQKIQQENRVLRERLAQLTLQNQALVDKKLQALGQIKGIVNQLREEIHERIL